MESQKTTIELKLSLAELDLILDALDAYPDSENVQGMDGKKSYGIRKIRPLFDLRKFVPANRILVVK